jgi:hypothetical protein
VTVPDASFVLVLLVDEQPDRASPAAASIATAAMARFPIRFIAFLSVVCDRRGHGDGAPKAGCRPVVLGVAREALGLPASGVNGMAEPGSRVLIAGRDGRGPPDVGRLHRRIADEAASLLHRFPTSLYYVRQS